MKGVATEVQSIYVCEGRGGTPGGWVQACTSRVPCLSCFSPQRDAFWLVCQEQGAFDKSHKDAIGAIQDPVNNSRECRPPSRWWPEKIWGPGWLKFTGQVNLSQPTGPLRQPLDHRRTLARSNAKASLKCRIQWHLDNICLRRDVLVTLMQSDLNLEGKHQGNQKNKAKQNNLVPFLYQNQHSHGKEWLPFLVRAAAL